MADLVGKRGSVELMFSQQPSPTSSSEPFQLPAISLFPIHPSALCFQTASTAVSFWPSTNQARSLNIFEGETSRARWVCFRTGGRPNDFHPPQPSSHKEPESSIAKFISVSQLLAMISFPTVAQRELSPAKSRETDSWRSGKRFSSIGATPLRVSATSLSCDAIVTERVSRCSRKLCDMTYG